MSEMEAELRQLRMEKECSKLAAFSLGCLNSATVRAYLCAEGKLSARLDVPDCPRVALAVLRLAGALDAGEGDRGTSRGARCRGRRRTLQNAPLNETLPSARHHR